MKAIRPLVRAAALALACLSLAWAVWLTAVGGFDRTVLGVRVRSNNPERVVIVAAIALAGYLLAGGALEVRPRAARLRRLLSAVMRRPGWIAGGIAAIAAVAAAASGTRIAGGADAYGYVSQADLWVAGDLRVDQPWVAEVPWPNGPWTFTPLGYRPVEGEWAVVPTYSPGLPMLMAAAKLAGGQCAMFAVVPLSLGVAVLSTYGLGRRLGSVPAGLIGAWLVATSPVVLEVALESLTDVPVMAAWSVAFYALLGRGPLSAFAAGLSAAVAILIRPNLFPLAAPMAAWFLLRRGADAGGIRTKLRDAALFGLGVAPGIAGVAAVNQHLYGSAFSSGYGTFDSQFAWAHVFPNMRRFVAWLVDTHTPLALIGIAALACPMRRVWPGVRDRRVFLVIGLYVALLWGQYSAYLEFDSAGYLRFLLPSWPFIMIGLGSVLTAVARADGRSLRWIVSAAIVALGAWNVHVAARRSVFDQRQAARHEAPLGRLVRSHTDENSVILAVHRSGSMRYYAGRTTARYDMLDPAWLDRAVAWMTGRGIRVYALLDERETAEARSRFAGQKTASAFDRPLLVYQPASTSLFDLSAAPDPARGPILITDALDDLPGCDPPAPAVPLVLR